MINKTLSSLSAAVGDIYDGATVMIGGFGTAGMPSLLIDALIEQGARDLIIKGARDLIIINNNAGNGDTGLAALLKAKRVRKIICSFPRQSDSHIFDELYHRGEIELELVPQGNLAERIRAAGAGIGGFYTPTGYGTLLAEGQECREINGRNYVFELPLHADFALIKNRGGSLVNSPACDHGIGACNNPISIYDLDARPLAANQPFRGTVTLGTGARTLAGQGKRE